MPFKIFLVKMVGMEYYTHTCFIYLNMQYLGRMSKEQIMVAASREVNWVIKEEW